MLLQADKLRFIENAAAPLIVQGDLAAGLFRGHILVLPPAKAGVAVHILGAQVLVYGDLFEIIAFHIFLGVFKKRGIYPLEMHCFRHKEWQTAKDIATCQLMNLILFSVFCQCGKPEVIPPKIPGCLSFLKP
mgnify:FL=1